MHCKVMCHTTIFAKLINCFVMGENNTLNYTELTTTHDSTTFVLLNRKLTLRLIGVDKWSSIKCHVLSTSQETIEVEGKMPG